MNCHVRMYIIHACYIIPTQSIEYHSRKSVLCNIPMLPNASDRARIGFQPTDSLSSSPLPFHKVFRATVENPIG